MGQEFWVETYKEREVKSQIDILSYTNIEKYSNSLIILHNSSYFSQPLCYLHHQQHGLNQHLNQWEEELDEEIPQDYMKNWDNSRCPIATTKYHQTSRDCKYTTSRDRNKHLTNKWWLQNIDGRRHIQYIRGFMKHYPRRHGELSIPYTNTLSRQIRLM